LVSAGHEALVRYPDHQFLWVRNGKIENAMREELSRWLYQCAPGRGRERLIQYRETMNVLSKLSDLNAMSPLDMAILHQQLDRISDSLVRPPAKKFKYLSPRQQAKWWAFASRLWCQRMWVWLHLALGGCVETTHGERRFHPGELNRKEYEGMGWTSKQIYDARRRLRDAAVKVCAS